MHVIFQEAQIQTTLIITKGSEKKKYGLFCTLWTLLKAEKVKWTSYFLLHSFNLISYRIWKSSQTSEMTTLGLKKKGLKNPSWVEHQPRNANDTNSRCHFILHRKLGAPSYMKNEQEDTWRTEARFEGKRIFCLVKLNDWFTMQWGRFEVFRQAQLIFIPINNAAPLSTRHNVPELPTPTFHTAQLHTPGTSQALPAQAST